MKNQLISVFGRLLVTFVVSSLWHGVYAGYYLCLCSVPFYLPAEDMFYKAFKNNSLPSWVSDRCVYIILQLGVFERQILYRRILLI
jgi:hypothetical protein